MLEANYFKPGQGPAPNNYMEHLNYDKNGNITSLQRNGDLDSDGMMPAISIDDLKYTYHPQKPNQLTKVEDGTNSPQGFKDGTNSGDDYTYDANGNMISDQNKGIENISYNHLNLPTKIIFGNGYRISYLYNATGQKVSKKVEADAITTTDYLSGFQYTNAKLNFFPHAEGYVNVIEFKSKLNYNYVFNYTDHLGNIRLSYAKDPSTTALKVIEENHYYPFGLKHTNYNSDKLTYIKREENLKIGQLILAPILIDDVRGEYNYKYNSKEYQDELGLNVYDYQNRTYDPATGRWWQMDPLAENGRRWSPYNYAMNNPVYFIDPDGMWPENPLSGLIQTATNYVKKKAVAAVKTVALVAAATAVKVVKQKANDIADGISNTFKTTNSSSKKSSSKSSSSPIGVDLKVKDKDNQNDGMVEKEKGGRDTPTVEIDEFLIMWQAGGSRNQTALVPTAVNEESSTDDNSSSSTMESSTNTDNEGDEEKIDVERQNWSSTPRYNEFNESVPHKGTSKDTSVSRRNKVKVDMLNKRDSIKAVNESKKKNNGSK